MSANEIRVQQTRLEKAADVIRRAGTGGDRFRAGVCDARRTIEQWLESGGGVILRDEPEYPEELGRIFDPPPILFTRGQIAAIDPRRPRVAVVGSRNADTAGLHIAHSFSRELATAGVTVVSGLAYGVDGAAHSGAIESGEPAATVAVLAGGLDRIYPTRHQGLARQIIENGGCLISQFAPGEPSLPHNFLNRNRVIAGLSRSVLIVQAAERSGSLVTARCAVDEGRDVFAIPGSIADPRHAGCHRLIQEGAFLTVSVTEILSSIPEANAPKVRRTATVPEGAEPLIRHLLDCGECEIDEVLPLLKRDGTEHLILFRLELDEVIVRLPGGKLGRGSRFPREF